MVQFHWTTDVNRSMLFTITAVLDCKNSKEVDIGVLVPLGITFLLFAATGHTTGIATIVGHIEIRYRS